jgi:hypothetical protein
MHGFGPLDAQSTNPFTAPFSLGTGRDVVSAMSGVELQRIADVVA